jgi:cell division protein FtsB
MKQKLIYSLLVLLFVFLVYHFGTQIFDSLSAEKRLEQELDRVADLQRKNEQFKQKLTQVNTVEFVEQQARNKMNLSRPDETVIIIPQQQLQTIISMNTESEDTRMPNWQGWLKLFF